MSLESDVQAFAEYARQYQIYAPTTVFGALLFRLAEGGISGGGSTGDPVTGGLTVATTDGTITAGAKYVCFSLSSDAVGEIAGTSVNGSQVEAVEFPAIGLDYTAFAYTISAGSFTITEVR